MRNPVPVTNRIAIALGLIVAALVAIDLALGLGGVLFLARRLLALLEQLTFWH